MEAAHGAKVDEAKPIDDKSDVEACDSKVTGGNGEPVKSGENYPGYSLEESVRFASAAQKAGGNEAREEDVLKELNLKSLSSRAWSYRLSSARMFGLVERVGRSADAKIKITALYQRMSLPDGDADLRAAKVRAMLNVPLYVKLMQRYAGAPLPAAQQVTNILLRDFKLLDSVAGDAARAFLESLRFAGLVSHVGQVLPAQADTDSAAMAVQAAPSIAQPPAAPAPAGLAMSAVPSDQQMIPVPADFIAHQFQLRRDLRVMIPLPAELTARDVDRLHKWLGTLTFEDDVSAK